MATDSIIATQQPTNSTSQSIYSPRDKAAAHNTVDMKNDSDLEKLSRNSTSCDEESTDELGRLVIDLENDNDTEKVNKDMVIQSMGTQNHNDGRNTPVRNNNNNNSAIANSSCGNKYGHSSTASKVSGGGGKSGPSYTQNEGSVHSSKSTKSKSKKSSKSNKTAVSGLSHLPGPKTSTVTFNGTSHMSSNANSSTKLFSNFDTKSGLERKSSSSDEVVGKRVKSSKSKSHHKKHRHNEKNSSSHGSSKSDNPGEKSRSKSKHNNHHQSNAFTSNMLTYSRPSVVSTLVPNSSTSLSVASNLESGFRRSDSPKVDSFGNSHLQSQLQKRSQLTEHGRTPTTLAMSAPDGEAKVIQPYSDKDSHAGESSDVASNHGRKKHRKGQSTTSLPPNAGIAIKNKELADNMHQKTANNIQHCNGGKRDRSSCNPTSTVAVDDTAGMKRAKLDGSGKSATSPRISSSNSESNLRSVPQRNSNNVVENNKSVSSRKPQSPKPRSVIDIGDSGEVSVGNSSSDCGAIPIPPPVFAPSSIFAQSMPRYSASGHGEYANSVVTSSETASVWSSTSSNYRTDISRSSASTGPPIVNSHRSVGTVTSTSDIGVMTEPDALGPCEPGTSVHLDGIVWHETDTGMLVVNVTWRNRTYVGTLLDATKHDWAPPRFSDNDLEMELRGKSGRPKRSRGGGGVADATRKGRSRVGAQPVADDIKGSPSAAAKRRNKNSESETATDNDGSSTPRSSKRARLAPSRVAKDMTQQLQPLQSERGGSGSNGGSSSSPCSSPVFIECPHPKCNKRYKNQNGLKYHQSHAHCESDPTSESGNLKGDEKISADQDHLCPEEERSSETEIAPSPEKRGKESTAEESAKEHHCEPASLLSTDEEVSKSISKGMTGTLPQSDTSSSSEQINSSLVNATQRKNNANPTTSNVHNSHMHSFSSLSSALAQTVASSVSAAVSYGFTSNNSGHPMKSIDTTSHSVVHSEMSVSTVRATQSIHHPVLCEVSAADNESAQAVETLLQLQGPDDQFLPGLTAPYSQDSPHPTLSLVSLGDQPSVQGNAVNDLTTGIPTNSIFQPATSEVKTSSERHVNLQPPPSSKTLQPPPLVSSSKEYIPKAPITSPFQSRERFQETMQLSSSTIKPIKENCTSSLSTPISHLQGVKTVKGKTVPIPVDPNHGLSLSYAGAASASSLSTFNKKQKRKKKCDEKPETPPAAETDARFDESADSYKGSQSQFQSRHAATTEFSTVPSTPTTNSISGAAALNNMAVSLQNSHKPQNIALKTNESSVLLTSSAAAAAAGHKPENDLRLPPQHFGSRKLPGVVLSAATNPNHFSNNVTVTGTFHPHPDPHKPQTAVSAQAQDRIRAGRALSPATCNASSSNRNNNNKLAEIQANTPTGRPQQSEQSNLKPRSSVTQISPSTRAETAPLQEQEGNSAARSKLPDSSPWKAPQEHAMTKIQNSVENTIAHVYRDMASRGKDSTPAPLDPQHQNQSAHSRLQLQPNETRNIAANDEPAPQHRASTPLHRNRTLHEATIEVRGASPITQAKPPPSEPQPAGHPQAAYMSQFQQMYAAGSHPMFPMGGVGYIHAMDPMDPTYRVVATQWLTDPRLKQQYEQYMQDVQKYSYLQQQQLLAQQQQLGDKKTRKQEVSSKDGPKQECSSKPVSHSPGEPDKVQPWARQHPKRPSTGSPAPFQSQNAKEKSQLGGVLHPQHPRYKFPQPNSSTTVPARCQSVITTSPSASLSGSLHSRSDSLDRGRASTKDEGRLPMRKPSTPPARMEKSPEKVKETTNLPSAYRSPAASPYHHPAYQQAYDPNRSAAFRNPQPYPVSPGFPPGFVYPSNTATGAPPMLQAPTRWPPTSQLLNENQSPPAKDQPAARPRSPLREDAGRGRLGVKPRELTSVQYGVKDRRPREGPGLPAHKLNGSPDPKALIPTSVQPGRNSITGPPPSIEHRPSSPPTQRHHHTHHHIHKGMILPQYSYPASPVVAGSDAAYPASYPKRD